MYIQSEKSLGINAVSSFCVCVYFHVCVHAAMCMSEYVELSVCVVILYELQYVSYLMWKITNLAV